MKKFWTKKTIGFFVGLFTICSLGANGIAGTANLYIVILGVYLSYKILAKENI